MARAAPPSPLCPCAGSTQRGSATTRGGSDTSLENNNVYGLEPKVYVEGESAPAGAQHRRDQWGDGCLGSRHGALGARRDSAPTH